MQWSLTVWSYKEVVVEGVPVLIEPGLNVFNVFLDDIEPVLEGLRAEGIRIDSVNNLSEFDAVDPAALLSAGQEDL